MLLCHRVVSNHRNACALSVFFYMRGTDRVTWCRRLLNDSVDPMSSANSLAISVSRRVHNGVLFFGDLSVFAVEIVERDASSVKCLCELSPVSHVCRRISLYACREGEK